MIAISRDYREADCIAILELDVDYLPRPFSAQDLTARVRVAKLRRFKAAGHKRFYRRGSLVVDGARLKAGDVLTAPAGSVHRETWSAEGCELVIECCPDDDLQRRSVPLEVGDQHFD